MKYLGIVLARQGSKRIPGKNLAPINGRPMIQYTLDAALGCPELTRSFVSTDDPEIISLAERLGVEAPFVRPASLATDDATPRDAVIHALDWLEQNQSWRPDAVVLLQPTSPFRTSTDISAAIHAFEAARSHSFVSISPWIQQPRDFVIQEEDRMLTFPAPLPPVGKDQEQVFINGAIYITETTFLRSTGTFCNEGSATLMIDPIRGLDIDTPVQLDLARRLALSGLVTL